MTGASRKETWLSAITHRSPAASRFSCPRTSRRKARRKSVFSASPTRLPGRARKSHRAKAALSRPSTSKSAGSVAPAACSAATMIVPPTMKVAFMILTPAITRARRSSPAQACTAEKMGTTNMPLAAASPATSMAMRRPDALVKKAPSAISPAALGSPMVAIPRSIRKAAMTSPESGTGRSLMRPWATTAAITEPSPMPMAKSALMAVSTSMPPPMRVLISTGTSESAMAPVIQNQLTATPPIQRRGSSASCFNSSPVEAKILVEGRRSGAAAPVAGMKRLAAQHRTAITMSCATTPSGSRAWSAA